MKTFSVNYSSFSGGVKTSPEAQLTEVYDLVDKFGVEKAGEYYIDRLVGKGVLNADEFINTKSGCSKEVLVDFNMDNSFKDGVGVLSKDLLEATSVEGHEDSVVNDMLMDIMLEKFKELRLYYLIYESVNIDKALECRTVKDVSLCNYSGGKLKGVATLVSEIITALQVEESITPEILLEFLANFNVLAKESEKARIRRVNGSTC